MTRALRLWRTFRIEDIVLFLWLVLVEPTAFGRHRDGLEALTRRDAFVGSLWIAAAGLAIAGIATRSADEPTMEWMTKETPHAYAPLPLMIGVTVVAGLGTQKMGLSPEQVSFRRWD